LLQTTVRNRIPKRFEKSRESDKEVTDIGEDGEFNADRKQ
jgi:hypothetical protein